MDNLRSVLSMTLSHIPPTEILKGAISYDNITMEIFVKLSSYYVKNYSNDELENLFLYAQNEYKEQSEYVRSFSREMYPFQQHFNVFDAILLFAFRILQEDNGEPVCQYKHLLRWRMTSHELDEDVFTTAFLAYRDMNIRYKYGYRDFSWRPVIRHNNVYLNKLLSQGMAENHFHLKGSAPQFPLSWLSMMNNVTSVRFRKLMEEYEQKRLSVYYFGGAKEEHIYISYLKAALIRCYLYSVIIEKEFVIPPEHRVYDREGEELSTDNRIREVLRSKDDILFFRSAIQYNIMSFRDHGNFNEWAKERFPDYMMNGLHRNNVMVNKVNRILSGERWFMYTMFRYIYSKDKRYERYFNLFYAYLIIKETIRSELVQTNDNIGFDNFAQYQDRKEDFIEKTEFEQKYIEMAVKGTLLNQNILAMEARISPKKTAKANRDNIRKIDSWVCGKDNDLKKRYFFVFHFVKEKDNVNNQYSDIKCRHFQKRKALKNQAWAIVRFREKYPEEAGRVRGIDACAKEIGCRPEVFSQVYRFLKNHDVYTRPLIRHGFVENQATKVEQLSLTYHIGEDYLDIVDGLRAIDEAIRFLKLDCGSRIGHALALGVDVEEYYRGKNYKILISQQDYLDDLVWTYNRIKKFGLQGYEDLLLAIEQEYSKYFRIIYSNYISTDVLQGVVEEAKEYFRSRDCEIVAGYCNSQFHFRIPEYYSSWQLRGDDPECYINGYFQELDGASEWNQYSVNREHPDDYKMRYNPECALLYFLYHYSAKSKEEGAKRIEVQVSHQMVRVVTEIQQRMKRWISDLGIGIEVNPTSNYLIGTFKRYDKHPILGFYNLGLTASEAETNDCPQIPVCINTDDQGVFSTYLENEYALLALALEKMKDEKGRKKYNRTMVYQWIDNIRKMGLHLSFSNAYKCGYQDSCDSVENK